MALALTIAGVTKFIQSGSLNTLLASNSRGRAAFSVKSLDASYRPALDDEVIITEDGNRIFGGVVDSVRERGAAGESGVGIITEIIAVDFNAYADRRLASRAIEPGTLKQALQIIIDDFLGPFYGTTLDAGQVNGPSFPLLGYTLKFVSEILNDFAILTADAGEPYAWNIDAFNVLSMSQPSTVPAPFNIANTLPIPEVVGDIIVESKRGSTYANRFVIYVPPAAAYAHVESFTGNGTQTVFTLQYVPFANRGYVTSAGVFETLSIGGGGTWDYDPVTNTITRTTAPANGAAITIEIDGTFSALAAAEDAGEIAAAGLWEKFLVLDSIPAGTTAQAIADANLARSIHADTTVKYRTMEPGVLPGQSQTINVPRRNVNATAVITDVVIKDIGKDVIIRDVTAVIDDSQTNLGRRFRDVYKRWNILGSGGGAVPTVGTGGGQSSAAAPITSVQFNRNGAFGGDAAFVYNETTNSLVCGGGGSSITATTTESCQVFGYNCHIVDP